jgi:hypothetical protein
MPERARTARVRRIVLAAEVLKMKAMSRFGVLGTCMTTLALELVSGSRREKPSSVKRWSRAMPRFS